MRRAQVRCSGSHVPAPAQDVPRLTPVSALGSDVSDESYEDIREPETQQPGVHPFPSPLPSPLVNQFIRSRLCKNTRLPVLTPRLG